ncbi:peptide deformylase [Peptoniphilus sp. GNH]|nr:peptide deformylase [Clostridiales bacterium KA00134]UHR02979.1 peptide deformylase [Peptoniphilus sp. GNH]
MAIRNIRQVPDPILRKESRPVEVIDDRIKELIEDMMDTMYADKGVGLAAVQVGVRKRILVIDDREGNVYKMINPQIVFHEGSETGLEACLSVPGFQGEVERYKKLRMKFLDENGKEQEVEAEDFLARIMQHELDHLNGVVYTDRADNVIKQGQGEEHK